MTFSVLELSELLGVSKPTVNRAIKELEKEDQIKPQRQGAGDNKNKKLLLSDDDVIKIIKLIRPTDFEKIIQTNRKIAEYFETKAENNDKENGESGTRADQSGTKAEQDDSNQNKAQQSDTLIIEILRKELEDKQKIIDSLTEHNKMLITSNAYLSKLLEDKGDQTAQEGDFTELQKEAPAATADPTDQQPHKKTFMERIKAFFS